MVEGPVKADSNRGIPIPPWLRDDLMEMLKARGSPLPWASTTDPLFVNTKGRPINRDSFQAKIMRPAIGRALEKAPRPASSSPRRSSGPTTCATPASPSCSPAVRIS